MAFIATLMYRAALRALLPLPLLLSLGACSPEKTAHSSEDPSKPASRIAEKAATTPVSTDPPEVSTTPCGESDHDQDCWMLPRERAEFTEATFTNEGEPVVRLDRDNRDLAFYFEYPKSAEVDRNLAVFLRRKAVEEYRHNLAVGRDDRVKALKLGVRPSDYEKIVIETVWAVTARSPHLIGLARNDGNTNVHEQVIETPAIWDRKRAKMIKFNDLFTSPRAALRLMQPDYCADLKKEVAGRGQDVLEGAPVEATSDDTPVDCPVLSELLPPVPVDDRHGHIRGFTILVGHFRVWAEGSYTASAPVTPRLIALIKPEYRADFVSAAPKGRKA